MRSFASLRMTGRSPRAGSPPGDRMGAISIAKPATRPRLLSLKQRQYLIAFLFVLPALVNFAIFRYIPILMAGYASLFDYSLLGGFGDFVGGKNYVRAVEDDLFWSSMWVSFQYALMKVPAQVIISL